MTGKYKSGIKVITKLPNITKVQIATAFAAQINNSLEEHAKSLQVLAIQSEIPEELYGPIQDFFEIVIQSSDQYDLSLKQLKTDQLKKMQALKSAAEIFGNLIFRKMEKTITKGGKLSPVICQLIADVNHFIQQLEMTHHSYTPGMSTNTRPVNWSLREAVYSHILEHQLKLGVGKYPNLNAAQLRARNLGHHLSDRTYREIKALHKEGTLFHYTQPRKRQ
uniref:hypothetical protein n=1 Tax=Limnohabitans sp. TaxID=1907725 RepID=UPI004048E994